MSRIFLLSPLVFALILASNPATAQLHPACPDDSFFTVQGDNGIRYGWFEDATCILSNDSHPECPDESFFTVTGGNGIKYGWYNEATCIVAPADHPECPDVSFFTVTGNDGTHYGWHNEQTCVLSSIDPIDDPINTDPIDDLIDADHIDDQNDADGIDDHGPIERIEIDSQSYALYFSLIKEDTNGRVQNFGGERRFFFPACLTDDQYWSFQYSSDYGIETLDAETLTYSASVNYIPDFDGGRTELGENCNLSIRFDFEVVDGFNDEVRLEAVRDSASGEITGDCDLDYSGYRVSADPAVLIKFGGTSPGEGGATESCLFLGVDPLSR